MNCREILDNISQLNQNDSEYVVFPADVEGAFYGKDSAGKLVFVMQSSHAQLPPLCQETKSLLFFFNKKCVLDDEDSIFKMVSHVLVCKTSEKDKIEAFIRLTYAFSTQVDKNDQYYWPRLFSALSGLFDKDRQISEIELQGLFAELYVICYLEDIGASLAKFWQSQDRMKFDFSIDERKRLEIKSTQKQERVHHFRHEQLLSELYDIKIASVMLQKNDKGISLLDLINKIRDKHEKDFSILVRIESIIAHVEGTLLSDLKYDEEYIKQHLAFFDAEDIPHFNEKTPEGVFNTEYDCSLENVNQLSIGDISNWIGA